AGPTATTARTRGLRRFDPRLTGRFLGTGDLGQEFVTGVDQVLLGLDTGLVEQASGSPTLVGLYQGDHRSGGTRPSGTPTAVLVLLVHGWQSDVDAHV